ncbi:MAG: hypothetical protein J6C46_12755 [Clostridia bacterium]|nr:hypothetical protein [Clostridia bacterium]
MNKKGNILIFSVLFIAMILVVFLFVIIIYISEINSLLYNIKLDMYSINKSAIIAVNKGITSREKFSYDKETYEQYFKKMLSVNYNLNEDLKNEDGLIMQAKVLDYDVITKGKKDKYIGEIVKDTTIHSLIEVKIKPIIFKNLLEEQFTFEIHEDVILNTVNL